MSTPSAYFLPYQVAWITDGARFKIWEKSRRIGATYAQSYEDVLDAARAERPMDVWFSSADDSAAAEYIRYCEQWARLFQHGARDLGEVVIDGEEDIKARVIEFATGKRIHGLSSNPKAFRSKGGKLVLDEYAFHADAEALWKAALPIVTWGFPVRILSTYNGKGNRYYRLVDEARKGNQWALHTTTIESAVAEGLADRMVGMAIAPRVSAEATAAALRQQLEAQREMTARAGAHAELAERVLEDRLAEAVARGESGKALRARLVALALTPEERSAWLGEQRAVAGDEETWQQEFMCQPVDEATAWLTWELITACEHAEAGLPERYAGSECYVGMDIGRRRDLTVIWVLERVGDVLWTREVVRLRGASFAEQDAEEDRIWSTYDVRRMCKDQTGMGEKPVEDSQRRYGAYRVEGVQFTAAVKQHLATVGKAAFEDRRTRIPADTAIRASHHSVRKLTTVAGNPRFDAERTEVGHADEFWAHMLALHAAEDTVQPPAGVTVEAGPDTYAPAALRGQRRPVLRPRPGRAAVRA